MWICDIYSYRPYYACPCAYMAFGYMAAYRNGQRLHETCIGERTTRGSYLGCASSPLRLCLFPPGASFGGCFVVCRNNARRARAMVLLLSLFLPALVLHPALLPHPSRLACCARTAQLAACANEETKAITSSDIVVQGETTAMTKAEVEKIGNLVEDDEWLGLATELAIVFWSAVRETIKANVADFIGKDDYKLDDVSKEADARIKGMVADLRGKDEYELGDLSIALDTLVKEEVREMTDGLHECLHDCL